MGLQRYREKRDFRVTPEPEGGKPSKTGFSYVIQKHDATQLHYDFRLELDGVLLSWAVPKGPSLDPAVRRLAMQTEDHPVEYGGFEGTIPEGEYGGGTVMVWDRGTWEPLEDPRKAYTKGHLRFALHGEKLRGAWHLVRTGKASDEKKSWLLFKARDAEARAEGSIVDEQQNSAKSGRTMDQIAGAGDKVWHSNRPARGADRAGIFRKDSPAGESKVQSKAPRREKELEALLAKAKAGRLPQSVETQRPTAVKKVPTGPNWAHELKYDGARILARLENGAVTLQSDGDDWTGSVPSLAGLIAQLPFSTALFDGEIAVARPDGTTDFDLLEDALQEGVGDEITFFAFDLLHLNGRDLRPLPLGARKSILEIALGESTDPRLHYSRHLVAAGDDFFKAACKVGADGVVSKKLDQPYRPGKGRDWVVTRCASGASSAKSKKGTLPKRGGKPAAPPKTRARAAAAETSRPNVTAGIRFTHPDRILFPRDGITKQEVAEYYAAVSPWMIPHVANRPLTLVRCPQGIDKQKFFQKNAKPPLPKAIRSIPIDDEGATLQYMAIDDRAGLIDLVQMSVVEIHTWGAHADDPEKPDFLVFDLDPDAAVRWANVIACAQLMRKGLLELGLESYVKTTGGKGLHVCVPIARGLSWDEAKEFCRGLTELIVRLDPQAYVATMSKAQRTGKIFIDFFRNGRGATFIAPYSTRARDGATVAMPLAWDELSPKIGPDSFNVRNVMKRMSNLAEDPWKDASSKKQKLSAAAIRAVLHPAPVRAAGSHSSR